MSIEKTWGEINEGHDDDLSSMLKISGLAKLSSHNPLEKLKRNLLLNIAWGVVICILYVVVIFYFQIWQVQVALAIVLIFSVWCLYTSYKEYKKINTTVSSSNSLLAELKRHHQSITCWINTQQRIALFIYPVSTAGGFMLGGVLGSGKPVETFMNEPFFWVALLIAIIILEPACYYLTKWMFNYIFGKHLKALEQNIKAFEEEK